MPLIEFQHIRKAYPGAAQAAVEDLNLSIEAGEFITLLGPSGSGKTTTLMMLAGFEPPSSGRILLDGQPIEALPPHQRNMGVVFQSYSLFPHMTVAANVGFPLSVRKVPAEAARSRVEEALRKVRLEHLAQRKPAQLSGGQQQRVALARALVFGPQLVLMDEPLSALDKKLREEMQLEIRRLHRELGVTMVFVTHDQAEAMTLSDRVAVFNHGRIEQLAAPQTLYEAPANAFVAGFIGDNNLLQGERLGADALRFGPTVVHARPGPSGATGASSAGSAGSAQAMLCVRPEHLRLEGTAPAGQHLAATVLDVIHQGDHFRAVLQLQGPGSPAWTAKLNAAAAAPLHVGQAVTLHFEPQQAWLF